MNWHIYWLSAALSAVGFAVMLAVVVGRDATFKESEMSTDLWLVIVVSAFLGALWPLTGLWLVLNVITGCVRARRKRAAVAEWERQLTKDPMRAMFTPKDP